MLAKLGSNPGAPWVSRWATGEQGEQNEGTSKGGIAFGATRRIEFVIYSIMIMHRPRTKDYCEDYITDILLVLRK